MSCGCSEIEKRIIGGELEVENRPPPPSFTSSNRKKRRASPMRTRTWTFPATAASLISGARLNSGHPTAMVFVGKHSRMHLSVMPESVVLWSEKKLSDRFANFHWQPRDYSIAFSCTGTPGPAASKELKVSIQVCSPPTWLSSHLYWPRLRKAQFRLIKSRYLLSLDLTSQNVE